MHKGFDLYSAAVPVCLFAFFLNATLFKTVGIALPAAPGADTLLVASRLTVNLFCGILFGLCIVFARAMGCKPKQYWALLTAPEHVGSVSSQLGTDVFLMNVGVFGLFILAYYNIIGASFNGVTLGIIFCMLCTCNSGSHPGNVWPIMLGYVAASLAAKGLCAALGTNFTTAINAQAIVIGLCFANGLSPVTGVYGWLAGVVFGMIHYTFVTCVPLLHGAFCLYNGGFTAAFTCFLFIPVLEHFCKTKKERRELRARK